MTCAPIRAQLLRREGHRRRHNAFGPMRQTLRQVAECKGMGSGRHVSRVRQFSKKVLATSVRWGGLQNGNCWAPGLVLERARSWETQGQIKCAKRLATARQAGNVRESGM